MIYIRIKSANIVCYGRKDLDVDHVIITTRNSDCNVIVTSGVICE